MIVAPSWREKRTAAERPFQDRHAQSVADQVDRDRVQPRGLVALLGWFREKWVAEMPEEIHSRGVWHDRQGASALGAPQWADDFRRFLTASPHELDVDYDEWASGLDPDAAYVRPLRSALARMAGRDPGSAGAFAVRFLMAIGFAGFDWRAVGDRLGYHDGVTSVYAEWALARLWRFYRPRPEPRTIRDEGVAAEGQ